jgi:type II secretory pathway component GspD/PulD (secretin)
MIANFTPSLLRLSQLIIVCGLLLLSACSYIDKLSDQQLEQEISTEQRELLQLESAKPKIDKSLQQQSTSLDIESPTPHSPIYCSKSGEYPDQLPSVALSFYEASVRDVFAEMSLLIDFPIVIDEFVEGVVTIETNNIRLDKALDLISATSNLSYRFFNEYILVGVNSVDTPSWASLSITCRFWPQYVSAELLFNSLGDIEKEFVFYPKGSDYLSISAPPGIQRKIQESLFVFDHSPGQVLLELSIVEITATDINRLGIRWHENNASLAQGIIGDEPDLIKQLQILAKSGQTQIKAMPSLLSGHGKKAKFSTMQQANQWQVKEQDQSETNRTQSSKKEEREILEYGVQMEIVPYIIDSDTVTLNIIDATVSDLVVGGDGYLQLIKHRVSNQVTVDNGEFILLGGMMQQSNITHTEGIPKLKNIPLLGRLFGQKKQRNSDYEIWIMIRPSILKK